MSNTPPPPPPSPGSPPPPPSYGQPAPGFMPGGSSGGLRNGLGTAALILGILSILGSFLVIGIVLGIIGIVLGIIGRKRAKRGEADNGGIALGGIITSIIGVLLSVAILVAIIVVLTSEDFQNFTDCADAANGDEVKLELCRDDFERDLTD